MSATLTEFSTLRELSESVTVDLPDSDETLTFKPTSSGPSDGADVFIERQGDGNYRITWLEQDNDPGDQWEWTGGDEKPESWCNAAFKDFRNQHEGGGQEARDAFYAEMVEKVGADRVFLVEVYSHGLEAFSRVDAGVWYPDRQWDVCAACVIAVPPDATEPAEYADAVLKSYTAWCQGDVYGIISCVVDPDGTLVSDDSVWGFIGYEYAVESAKSGVF